MLVPGAAHRMVCCRPGTVANSEVRSVADFDAPVTPAVAVPEALPLDMADRAFDIFRRVVGARRGCVVDRFRIARLAVGDRRTDDGAERQAADHAGADGAAAAAGFGGGEKAEAEARGAAFAAASLSRAAFSSALALSWVAC